METDVVKSLEHEERVTQGYMGLRCITQGAWKTRLGDFAEFELIEGPHEDTGWRDLDEFPNDWEDFGDPRPTEVDAYINKYQVLYGTHKQFMTRMRTRIVRSTSMEELYELIDEINDHDTMLNSLGLFGGEADTFGVLERDFGRREWQIGVASRKAARMKYVKVKHHGFTIMKPVIVPLWERKEVIAETLAEMDRCNTKQGASIFEISVGELYRIQVLTQ